jgi:hypothetical protein
MHFVDFIAWTRSILYASWYSLGVFGVIVYLFFFIYYVRNYIIVRVHRVAGEVVQCDRWYVVQVVVGCCVEIVAPYLTTPVVKNTCLLLLEDEDTCFTLVDIFGLWILLGILLCFSMVQDAFTSAGWSRLWRTQVSLGYILIYMGHGVHPILGVLCEIGVCFFLDIVLLSAEERRYALFMSAGLLVPMYHPAMSWWTMFCVSRTYEFKKPRGILYRRGVVEAKLIDTTEHRRVVICFLTKDLVFSQPGKDLVFLQPVDPNARVESCNQECMCISYPLQHSLWGYQNFKLLWYYLWGYKKFIIIIIISYIL